LKSTGLAIRFSLWETIGMPKEGEIVTTKDYPGQAFKILKLQDKSAMIQRFNVSRQTLGDLILTVPIAAGSRPRWRLA
jgi:hypothetical protein